MPDRIHSQAQAAIIAIQNQLPQLHIRYDPSVAHSVQYYIDLLRQRAPSEAARYQQELNALLQTRSRAVPIAPSPVSVPKPSMPPMPTPAITKPPTDLPPALPPVVEKPGNPVIQPSASPSDLPPASPMPSAPTDVPQPPARPLPCIPDAQSKKDFMDMQERAMHVLQKFIPRVKDKPRDEAKKILLADLKNFVKGLQEKNLVIRNKIVEMDKNKEALQRVTPINFDITIKAYESLASALDSAIVMYGNKDGEITAVDDYFKEIRAEFHGMSFAYAQALVDRILRMIANDISPVRDEISAEDRIGHAMGVMIDVSTMVHVLAMIHLPRIVLNLEPSDALKKLIKRMVDLFTVFKDVLVNTRHTFNDQIVLPLWLKEMQKEFYSLTASVLTVYIDAMPYDAVSQPQKETEAATIQAALNEMNKELLKLRLGPKKSAQ